VFALVLLSACGGGSEATLTPEDAADGSVADATDVGPTDAFDANGRDAVDAAPDDVADAPGDVADAGAGDAGEAATDASDADAVADAPPIDAGPPLPVSTARVASGDEFTCRIRAGQLWCWGFNRYGELGTGDTTPVPLPTRIGADADWQFVSAGAQRACAIKASGKLYCWGGNASAPTPPRQVGTASDWAMVSVGGDTTCALRSGHTLWCWGSSGAPIPAQVDPSADWSFVSAGQHHRCGLRADGSAWCWGTDFFGQLGDGGGADKSAPVRAFTGTFTHLVAASDYTCGSVGGALYCWGFIDRRRLAVGERRHVSRVRDQGGQVALVLGLERERATRRRHRRRARRPAARRHRQRLALGRRGARLHLRPPRRGHARVLGRERFGAARRRERVDGDADRRALNARRARARRSRLYLDLKSTLPRANVAFTWTRNRLHRRGRARARGASRPRRRPLRTTRTRRPRARAPHRPARRCTLPSPASASRPARTRRGRR
jgi:hypothetical protein